jgi:hypothetical protein
MAILLVGLFLVLPPTSQGEDAEAAVRITIQAFNKAFNEGFVGPADYATTQRKIGITLVPLEVAIAAAQRHLRRCAQCTSPS